MAENKGKPSGKYADDKTSPGRKADYKRSGWPEDAETQRVPSGTGQQQSKPHDVEDEHAGTGQGRNRKAGSPI